MVSRFRNTPPLWFWLLAAALVLWEAMGVWSWYQHQTLGPAAMGNIPTEYDVRYFAKLPAWYSWLFAVATISGLIGGLLLLARKAAARPAFIGSLIATVLMFSYTFLATDLAQVKGVWTTYFPALIILVGAVSVWFAGHAMRWGWIG